MKITIAIVVIAVILLVALLKGLNGVLMSSGIGIISGLAGFSAGRVIKPK